MSSSVLWAAPVLMASSFHLGAVVSRSGTSTKFVCLTECSMLLDKFKTSWFESFTFVHLTTSSTSQGICIWVAKLP
uniref:Putative secreted protein n=1 Tax=Ixodes ricinus TaxID=34613 RepID=A0A6B0U3Y2_IXORI